MWERIDYVGWVAKIYWIGIMGIITFYIIYVFILNCQLTLLKQIVCSDRKLGIWKPFELNLIIPNTISICNPHIWLRALLSIYVKLLQQPRKSNTKSFQLKGRLFPYCNQSSFRCLFFYNLVRKMSVADVVDPSSFILTCCGISLAWAAIQFSIISQTK